MTTIRASAGRILTFVCGVIVGAILFASIDIASALPDGYSPYRKLQLFARALTYVENNYVDPVDSDRLIEGALSGMFNVLDPHSTYLSPADYAQLKADTEGEFGGIGVEVEQRDAGLTIVRVLDDSPAAHGGVLVGDRISEIDGVTVEGMSIDDLVKRMRGTLGSSLRLKLLRQSGPSGAVGAVERELTRQLIRVSSVESKLLDGNIGYLRLRVFQERTADAVRRAVGDLRREQPLRGLVLDLRDNPGGLLEEAVAVADLFLEEGVIVTTIGREKRILQQPVAHKSGTLDAFPIVCLINDGSASAAEILVGALQDHQRAVIIGERSFGKGSVQSVTELPDGSAIKLTVARYLTPSGHEIQRDGIHPSEVVPSRPTTPAARDPLLDRAVAILRQPAS